MATSSTGLINVSNIATQTTTSSGSAGISQAGLISGLNVTQIVNAIINSKSAPLNALKSQSNNITSNISALGQIGSNLDNLSKTIANITNINQQSFLTTTVSDPKIFSATADSTNASLGNHSIIVSQLASAQQLSSAGFADTTSSIGTTGQFTVQSGSNSFQVNIDNSNNNLSAIVNAINKNVNNTSVQASILQDNSGPLGTAQARIILTAKQSGSANAITLTDNTGNVSSTLNISNQLKPAQDAQFSIDGFNVIRSSNTISDALQGITFKLTNTSNTPVTLNISEDLDSKVNSVEKNLSDFVSQYNTIIKALDFNTADNNNQVSSYNLIKKQLQSVLQTPAASATFKTLSELNITTDSETKSFTNSGAQFVSTGSLKIDSSKLDNLLRSDFSNVIKTLNNSTDGIFTRLQANIKDINHPTAGLIISAKNGLQSRQNSIENSITANQKLLDAEKQRVTLQFNKLDAIQAQFQVTSNYLTQSLFNNKSS